MIETATEHWWHRWPKVADKRWVYWLIAAVLVAVVAGALLAYGGDVGGIWPFDSEGTTS